MQMMVRSVICICIYTVHLEGLIGVMFESPSVDTYRKQLPSPCCSPKHSDIVHNIEIKHSIAVYIHILDDHEA